MFLRKFIILSKQSSKDLKSHVKLEVRGVKGKISLSLEGAQLKEDVTYKLYSATSEQKGFKEVSLGTIDVNKSGRGKLDLNFNSNSVGQSEIDISDFNTLIIKEENSKENNQEVILAGYIHKDDDSIAKVISANKSQATSQMKPQIENKVSDKESEKTQETEKINEVISEETEDNKKTEVLKQVKETTEFRDQSKMKTQKDIIEPEVIKKGKIEVEEVKNKIKNKSNIEQELEDLEARKEEKYSSKNYSDQIISYTLDILKIFKEIKPFKIEDESYRWWQIDYDKMNSHRGFLPYYSYILNPPYSSSHRGRYTTCQNQIQKYNRYLFGVAENNGQITHYIYGIPGRYEKSEHPYGGSTGFVTWLEDKSRTGSGYWLSYIDAYTGNVVRPL